MKNKRGLSTVIGVIFFIIAFTSVAGYVTYATDYLEKVGDAIVERSQEDRNRTREEFEITRVTRDNNKFNITVQNTGELPVNITRLWVQNKTDPSWATAKYDINNVVYPGKTLTKIGQNIALTAKTTQAYDLKLVTERGNVEVLVNSASQEPLLMHLSVVPDEILNNSTVTLLYGVTNNMSNGGSLSNLVPNLVITSYGATVTLVSGPEPAMYPLLDKGDTAYFKWIYRVSGTDDQKVNFKTSLVNGYLNNFDSKNATVNVVGSPTVKTIIGGGLRGTLSTSSQNYLRFFGDDNVSTNYGHKNMTLPMSGTIKNLYVSKGTGAVSVTFTLYKNGVATSLSCVTPAQSQTACSDTINSVSVTTGDHIAMGIRPSSSTSTGDLTFTVQFDPF